MCTGAEVAAIAGTAANQYGDMQTRNDQQRETQRRADEAAQLNARAGERVGKQVEELKASTKDAGHQDEIKLQSDFMDALRRSQLSGGGAGLDNTPGATSDQYNADAATARGTNAAGNRAAATTLARIDAPFMQRVRETTSGMRLNTDLSRLANEGQGQDFLSRLRSSLITPNAGLEATGDLLNGFAQGRSQRTLPKKAGGGVFSQLPNQTPSYGSAA
jgi:hypothetical protein